MKVMTYLRLLSLPRRIAWASARHTVAEVYGGPTFPRSLKRLLAAAAADRKEAQRRRYQ